MSHFVVYVITEEKDIDTAFAKVRKYELNEDDETQIKFFPSSDDDIAYQKEQYQSSNSEEEISFEEFLMNRGYEFDQATGQYGYFMNDSEFDYCTIGGRFSDIIPDDVCRCADFKKDYMEKFIAAAIVLPDGKWVGKSNFDKNKYGGWEEYLLHTIASFPDNFIWLVDAHE